MVVTQQVFGCFVMVCLHVAFWCQCRGLLVWVRIRGGRGGVGGRKVYWGVLGVLAGLGAVSWVFRVGVAGYQVYWFGIKGVVDWDGGSWTVVLNKGSSVSAGISFGCWSLAFVVSAGLMLWERRKIVLSDGELTGVGGGGGGKRKRKVQGVCEKALNLIGFVGVESLLIPCEFLADEVETMKLMNWLQ